MKRKASAVWSGSGKDGKGKLTTQSGAFRGQPYSAFTRFENEDGLAGTNPEELIGAAHAGCYAMALSFALSREGFVPDTLIVDAVVHLEKGDAGFSIPRIDLRLSADVPGIEKDQFMALANDAKENCPVSKVLNADIHLEAILQ